MSPTLVENLACLLAYIRLFLPWGPSIPERGEIAITSINRHVLLVDPREVSYRQKKA